MRRTRYALGKARSKRSRRSIEEPEYEFIALFRSCLESPFRGVALLRIAPAGLVPLGLGESDAGVHGSPVVGVDRAVLVG